MAQNGKPAIPPGMRERILSEATLLFTRSGYNAISMREIAAACGITKAGLYYHFNDKEALIVAIMTGYLIEINQLITACRAASPNARGRLTAFIRGVFAQPAEKRAIIRLASQEITNLSSRSQTGFNHRYHEDFIDPLGALLTEGMQSGELRPADSRQLVWVLLGMMYPFFYPGQDRFDQLEEGITLIITTFFDGIARHD
jgi:AcrR family transcriptional regulator